MLEGLIAFAGVVVVGSIVGHLSDQNRKILRAVNELRATQPMEMNEVNPSSPPGYTQESIPKNNHAV